LNSSIGTVLRSVVRTCAGSIRHASSSSRPRRRKQLAEESRSRWGDRTSNPGGAVRRSQVGSTPILLRHPFPRCRNEPCHSGADRRIRSDRQAAQQDENAVRKRMVEEVAHLERQRGFAYRKLNLVRTLRAAIASAESEKTAVAQGLEQFPIGRNRLGIHKGREQ
jgi:hypothetical protein